ncbi:PAS domain S-box protein [Flavobacterium sp.]|uniref:PAS domain S-box protein n=1 Tax=Flavobacterium sp. TaxID=239 RepID=UPI002488E294|nr:PAS domain S-box protein [Flavobacterium sp.]MDI1315948.1 PAS domain S-box protein [Flavobacterium sp.]
MISEKSLIEFFNISSTPSLVLLPDGPKFTIVEVNPAYLASTNSMREDLIGKGILEAFPYDASDPTAESLKNLTQSLNTVIKTKKSHKMALQKYPIPIKGTSKYKLKYRDSENSPLLNDCGDIKMIIHSFTNVTEKKVIDENSNESKISEKLRTKILLQTEEIAKIGRWERDFVTGKMHWSDNLYLLLGYQPQEFEITMEKIFEFIHPDDIERRNTLFEHAQKNQEDFYMNVRFVAQDKSIVYITIRGVFIFDNNGKPKKIVGTIQDTTDITTAEFNALESKRAIQKILDLSLDIICTGDELGNFLTTNAACELILGYTPEEFKGKNFTEFVYKDDFTKSIDAQEEVVSGIAVKVLENTMIHKDGRLVSMLWSARFDESEKIVYGVGKDVTNLKIAKKEAKEKQDFIEIALKNLPIGVTIQKVDENFKVLWMNSKVTEINGWPAEVMSQFPDYLTKIFPDERYRNEISESIMNDIRTGDKDKINSKNLIITTQTGEQKIMNALSIPIPEQNLIISTVMDVTDQVQAQKIIHESNERYEYVTKATSDAVWDWDLITDGIYYGEGFDRLFGYKIDAHQNNSAFWKSNIHPDDNESVLATIYNIINGKENKWMAEYRYKKSNGDYAFVNDKGIVIRDATGKAKRMVGAMQDITKQKEEELRLMLLETVITNTTDAVVIKEANPSRELGRKILYVNDAFTKMSGYAKSEIIGKTHKLLHGPNTDPKELELFYKALDELKTTNITILNYKKDGQEFWVNLVVNPVFNNKGEHTHWVSIERDVTESKIQEQNLSEVSQKLAHTLDSIQDGFYTLDNNWNVMYWNHVVEGISGKNQYEMEGMNIWDVYEGKISKKMYYQFHKAKNENKPVRLEIFSKISKNWFEVNGFPSSMGLTVYFKNINQRKHMENQLKKTNRTLETRLKELAISNEELERFAYIASHDLQEPLRMVTGFLTQIEKKYEAILDEKGKKYIFFAVDGAKRMRQIILDLLEFSRIGKIESKLEEINLNEIVHEVVLLYRKQIEEKKAKIVCKNLPIIKCYSSPVKQIFQNIISNSLKYSKSDSAPVIKITSEETPLSWKFVIQDNGIGINSEYFEKIFIIFQRLHNKDEYSGTGMGLAITKKIIDNLGGQIWLESEEGVGTAFHFTIPKKQTKRL